MRKITLILAIFLLITPLTLAATIKGNIYDIELNPAKNAILNINTIPEQTFVSKDGTYSLNIPPGKYIITTNYKELVQKQDIEIVEEGVYVLDLILYPEDIKPELPPDQTEAKISYWWYVGIILIIGLIVAIFYFKTNHKEEKESDDLTKDVLKFIKDEGGRTTQKDIRKKFPVSEAKVSLVITELEHKKVIKKIKKGRGNIIILN